VLVGVDVQQVGGFRGELDTLTLNKERVVVLDNLPNQFGAHGLLFNGYFYIMVHLSLSLSLCTFFLKKKK
jgi:hypothetical protein